PGRARRVGRPPVRGRMTRRRAVPHRAPRRHLVGRSAIAAAVRRWKEDVRRDLGGDLTSAQETILEAAQAWVIVSSLDAWIARQRTLVTKKRALLPRCGAAHADGRGGPPLGKSTPVPDGPGPI